MPGRNRSKFIKLIWEGIVRNQRKTRLLVVLEGVSGERADRNVSYSEALVLHVIESLPDKSVKEIAEILKLERSWVSRLITSLEDQKLVKGFIPEVDKRSKRLRIAKKGKEELLDLNAFRRRILQNCFQQLGKRELKQLALYYKKFADDLGAPQYIAKGSHPIDDEMARMSWTMGVLGNDFMQSGLNVTQYQICLLLDAHWGEEITTSELYEQLPFDMSTISRALTGFEKNGIVGKRQSKEDKRSFSVSFTAEGKNIWEEKKKKAYALFAEGLKNFTESELSDFGELLGKVTAELPRRKRQVLTEKVDIERVEYSSLDSEIKEYFDGQLAGQKSLGLKPTAKSATDYFIVSVDSEFKGIAAVSRGAEDETVEQFLFSGKKLRIKDCLRFVKTTLKKSS